MTKPLMMFAILSLPAAMAGQVYTGPMSVKLLSPVSTSTCKQGDKVSATVTAPSEYSGGIAAGVVSDCKSAGKLGGESSLNISFQSLTSKEQRFSTEAQITSFRNSKGQVGVDEEGRAVKHSRVVGRAILGAVAGAGVGYAIGGAKGAGAGAAVGAAAMIVVKMSTKAPAVEFASGSEVNLNVKVFNAN